MNQKELFEKIYNEEITDNEVIVQKHKKDEEDIDYIINDSFDFWYYNANHIVSLYFFKKYNDYEYDIISKDEFEKIINEQERQEKIKKLKEELAILEREGK